MYILPYGCNNPAALLVVAPCAAQKLRWEELRALFALTARRLAFCKAASFFRIKPYQS